MRGRQKVEERERGKEREKGEEKKKIAGKREGSVNGIYWCEGGRKISMQETDSRMRQRISLRRSDVKLLNVLELIGRSILAAMR